MSSLVRRGPAAVGSFTALLIATSVPGRAWLILPTAWRGLRSAAVPVRNIVYRQTLRGAVRAGATTAAKPSAITEELLKVQF